MKRKEPIRITTDLLLRALGAEYGQEVEQKLFESYLISEIWPQVMGPTLRDYTSNLAFRQGTLYVQVHSAALRQNLFLQRTLLIKKLNDAVGKQAVFQIVLR